MKQIMLGITVFLLIMIIFPMVIVKGINKSNPGYITKISDISNSAYEETKEDFSEKIILYDYKNNKNIEINLEEYLKGVVAAEMPVEFELEALKSQAVAARTYALGRITGVYPSKDLHKDGANICSDSKHCQAWISKDTAYEKWKDKSDEFWNKISKAVDGTKGVILKYDGKLANPLYHSNAGGQTESSEEVWDGVKVPYLVSVSSFGDEEFSEYTQKVEITRDEFIKKIKKELNVKLDIKNLNKLVEIKERTESERVKEVKIAKKTMLGTQFREIFGLNSTNFSFDFKNPKTIVILVIGYGHGVGMSQCGADALAKLGYKYEDILKHYYTGINIEKDN